MAIAYVKEIGFAVGDLVPSSDQGPDQTFIVAAAPGIGNAVIIFAGLKLATGGQTFTVSDTKGNTWIVDAYVLNGTECSLIAHTLQNVAKLTTSDTITIHASGTINGYAVQIEEFSGVVAVDVSATNTGSGANGATGTTAPTSVASELVVSLMTVAANETVTKDAAFSAFTTGSQGYSGARATSANGAYKIVAATGPQSATYTAGAATFAACIVTFAGVVPPSRGVADTGMTVTETLRTATGRGVSDRGIGLLPVVWV